MCRVSSLSLSVVVLKSKKRVTMNRPSLLVALLVLIATTPVAAQLTQVNVMPGAPNPPRVEPHPARPGVGTLVWGNANGGDPVAVGWNYTWSFGPNPNVLITDDGSLSGVIAQPRFIVEEVTFTLIGATTKEVVDATLTVTDGTTTLSDTVQIEIIDPTDPISTPQTASLQVDVDIAIENGLRRLYLTQLPTGQWPGPAPCSETGFALWCFGNKGHLPTTPVASDSDIYAEFVQQALDYIFTGMAPAGTVAANADVARGAIAAGVSDLNGNGRSINPCPSSSYLGYEVPIVTAGIIASLSPSRLVTVGPFAGDPYLTIVEDLVDFTGTQQNSAPLTGPRGGFFYSGPTTNSDMSIASWYFVALEGAEQTNYSVPVPDWIKQEAEYALIYHQVNAAGPQLFGYGNTSELIPTHGRATTAAGLSGLALVETETSVTPGSIFALEPPPLNTIAAKRQAALDRLGAVWHVDSVGNLGEGNRNNFYTMWTVARTLRITAQALGLPSGQKVPLINGGVTFDWEFGEDAGSPGIVPGFGLSAVAVGPAREGYFNWLVRKQDNTNPALNLRGRWNQSTFISSWYSPTYETSLGTLVLIPEVFGQFGCAGVSNVDVQCDLTDPTSGTYTVTFDLQNNSGVDVTHLVLPTTSTVPGAPVTIAPNVIPQSPPLAPGDSTTVTVTIANGTAGERVCFAVGMLDEDFEECCGKEVCVTLPNCDCLNISNEIIECDPSAPGLYNYTFTITNISTITAENTFLLGNPSLPLRVTFTPDAFNYPPLAPGASITLSTQISGGTPGSLCFQVTLHDASLVDCCAVDHCITLPDCGNPCITNLHCDVDPATGAVVLSWTPPTDDTCCQELSLFAPGQPPVILPSAFDGMYVVPGPCEPGEYCLRCTSDPAAGVPPSQVCCTVEQDDCVPDPCIADLMCEVTPQGINLIWNPPAADPECCIDIIVTRDGNPIGGVDPFAGIFTVPGCLAGTYCIECVASGGVAGSIQCCTVEAPCDPVVDPVLVSTPVTVAAPGKPYVYDADGYLAGATTVPISYQLGIGPASATIDPDTGLISWTPNASDIGDHSFLLRALAGGGTGLQSWVVTVSDTLPATVVPLFVRGDCNTDGAVNVADVVGLLATLFEGGDVTCADACDANDASGVDISDAIFLLSHLFAGGEEPAFPFASGCGQDPTADAIDCLDNPVCP